VNTQQGKYVPKQMFCPTRQPVTVNSIDEEEQWRALGYEFAKPPAAFAPYPKYMTHPHNVPARMISAAKPGPPVSKDSPHAALASFYSSQPEVWDPEEFPGVFASNETEEAKFAAEGYRAAGIPDADAFAIAQAGSSPAREPIPYPKWVTPPQGEPILAKSESEERALLAKWGVSTTCNGSGDGDAR
jgi:hypothetical protein